MSRQESLEFGNIHNALKVFYRATSLQKQKPSPLNPKQMTPRTRISLTPINNLNKSDNNISSSTITQVSVLEPFLGKQVKKCKRKKQDEEMNKSLLDEFMVPKGMTEGRIKTKITITPRAKRDEDSSKEESVKDFAEDKKTPTKTPKKFVDLNLFKKKKQQQQAQPQINHQEKQNRQINSNQIMRSSICNNSKQLEIEDILSKSYSRSSQEIEEGEEKNIMNSEYFNLCQTYHSTQYERTELSAVKEEDVQESLMESQIKKHARKDSQWQESHKNKEENSKIKYQINIQQNKQKPVSRQPINTVPIPPMNNISQIHQSNNSFQESFLDLQKFIVQDLKQDIQSLCYKLNESGIFNNKEIYQVDNNYNDQEQSQILDSVKERLQKLKARIFTDCPFLQLQI